MLAGTVFAKPKPWHWRHFCSYSAAALKPPSSTEIHIWCILPYEIHQSSLLSSYETLLPLEERIVFSKAKNKKVQKEYLLTRILARTVLARYTGDDINPTALRFEKSTQGKPEVLWPPYNTSGELWDPPKISFNISHASSLIVCAVTGASQVGIDVEEKLRQTHTELARFARRRFSMQEARWLELCGDVEARKHYFLQLWTLKESYGKAVGKGISGTTLRDVAFHFGEVSAMSGFLERVAGIRAHDQIFRIRPEVLNEPAAGWQFILLQPTCAHYAAVCIRQTERDAAGLEPVHVQVMKTVPLVEDEPLLEAVALGASF